MPLNTKQGQELVKAFQTILSSGLKPSKLQTNQGTEFLNRVFVYICICIVYCIDIKRANSESTDSHLREITKLKFEEPRRFRKKANEDQYRFSTVQTSQAERCVNRGEVVVLVSAA